MTASFATVLDDEPAIGRAYLRALRQSRRPARTSIVPAIAFERRGVRIDAGWLGELKTVFGAPSSDGVPLTLPHVLSGGLQLAVLTDKAFPLRILGAVHVRSEMEQHRPIDPAGAFTVRVSLEGIVDTEKGSEHTLLTELLDGGDEVLWTGRSVNLTLDPHAPRAKKGERRPLPEAPRTARFEAPSGIGRRYGAISGDRNPIHMSRVTARLFGFKRAIAHGMWTVGRSLVAMDHASGAPGDRLSVRFKRPLLLPNEVEVRYGAPADDKSAAESAFWAINLKEGSVHVDGQLTAG